ncbi:hypothetical protein [Marinomonas mediterranea]|uniref:HTH araC/xylS-type domain-containing protein n=1 Tax=Marinomonas mediterranea (strain ATCC 700492 / JCM 21426 / NBRC 103028 / MMB-1) TaxID=717774 RepID=F2JXB0_MARM1|nr:hypothetical protein [Marinomonas mediterranea]ADZ90716.1 hypothetical protein Marme_1449 [Marinomonas mediterranea MMB-1]WCN08763.1 hypothetical protein GV055_07355 [Marinomonas mediterranea]WCN16877.1 hypothetical protein GV053_07290 [Marinomonas mediterranea MMB-1]
MQISIHDLFNAAGNVQDIWSLSVTGHRNTLHPAPGVTLLEQSICVSRNLEVIEEARPGLYISFYSSCSKTHADTSKQHCDSDNNECVQITYLPRKVEGAFPLNIDTHYHLTQIHLTPERCAALTGEPEDKIMSYFLEASDELGNSTNVVKLPITEQLKQVIQPVIERKPSTSRAISMTGKIYNMFFEIIEHLQIVKHINSCGDCQNKVLNGQNLLEVAFSSKHSIERTAQTVGLNQTAFEVGFFYLVGQSISTYKKQIRIKQAALELKNAPDKKGKIVTDTGLSMEEFEEAFLKQFGILSHHYGQIH